MGEVLQHVTIPASCCSVVILRRAMFSARNARRFVSLRREARLYNNVPAALPTSVAPLTLRA